MLAAVALAAYTYWIQPCTAELAKSASCEMADPDLGRWALEAWEKASGGLLKFTPAAERDARIRIYWARADMQVYGEARPVEVNGQRGAEIYVRLPGRQQDALMRDTVVYLTCLHESGHALGLPHTADFADIMYNFQYGGDIPEYFGRYRRALANRDAIRSHSGMSKKDEKRLREILSDRRARVTIVLSASCNQLRGRSSVG